MTIDAMDAFLITLHRHLHDAFGSLGTRQIKCAWGQRSGAYGRITVQIQGGFLYIPMKHTEVVARMWSWEADY